MDDILKRLGSVETNVAEIRVDVAAIKAVLPHLATKADLSDVRGEVNSVRGEIHALEARLIKWIIGTVTATAGLAFAIAKFVN